jgi:hypothetical protein
VTGALLAACGAGGEDPKAAHSPATKPRPSASASSTSTSPTATPTKAPVTLRQARREWHDAVYSTARELSGKYAWSAWVEGEHDPVLRETGSFGLDPMRTAFERVMRAPSTAADPVPREVTLRMRRRGDETYMQMADWGSWDGCWLHVTDDLVARSTGLDLGDSLPLPISVLVTLDSRVTDVTADPWFGDPYEEYSADVSAIEAIQFLGVSAKVLVSRQRALSRVRVPIVVAILTGRVKGAAARGPAVLAALRDAHVRIGARLRSFLPRVSAAVDFSNLGWGAEVHLPAARFVLPDGATRNRTCPAKTPLS